MIDVNMHLNFFNKLTHFEQKLLLDSFMQIDRDKMLELSKFFDIGEDHLLKLQHKVENHIYEIDKIWNNDSIVI